MLNKKVPKRRYAKTEKSKGVEKLTREYWFPDPTAASNKMYVCKRMFMATLGYTSDKVITTTLTTTSNVGITAPDKRGKHKPKHAMTDEQKEFVVEHINLFHPQISHYRREHAPNRLYLPPELTINEMYADYLIRETRN